MMTAPGPMRPAFSASRIGAVLDAPGGIEGLDLGDDVRLEAVEPHPVVELQKRRAADKFKARLMNHDVSPVRVGVVVVLRDLRPASEGVFPTDARLLHSPGKNAVRRPRTPVLQAFA